MSEELIVKAGEVVSQRLVGTPSGFCALGLIDSDGYPTVSTISAVKHDGIKWMTFCTGLCSPKIGRIKANNRTSVCFNSENYNITLVGTIEICTDPEIKKEMWYDFLGELFSGPDDPNYCVLRFKTERYGIFMAGEEVKGAL